MEQGRRRGMAKTSGRVSLYCATSVNLDFVASRSWHDDDRVHVLHGRLCEVLMHRDAFQHENGYAVMRRHSTPPGTNE